MIHCLHAKTISVVLVLVLVVVLPGVRDDEDEGIGLQPKAAL